MQPFSKTFYSYSKLKSTEASKFSSLASSIDSLRTSILQHVSFLVSRPTSDLVLLITHLDGIHHETAESSNRHTAQCTIILRTPDGRGIESVIMEWQVTATGPWPPVVFCLTQMYDKVDEMVKEKLQTERQAWGEARFKLVDDKLIDLGEPEREVRQEVLAPPPRYSVG